MNGSSAAPPTASSGWCPARCWWLNSARSGLLDAPQEKRRAGNDAFQVLAVGGLGRVLPGRDIRNGLEGALLDLGGDLLAGLAVARFQPFRPQFLELIVLRPAKPG